MSPDTEKRVDKIAKLLAKAERASTPEEAEAFSAKAQELMTEWQIDELMLRVRGEASTDKLEVRAVKLTKAYLIEDATLIHRIGEVNSVVVRYDRRASAAVAYGYTSDLDRTELLFTSLLIQCTRALTQEVVRGTATERWQYRRAFRAGFANAIGRRLKAEVNAARKRANQTDDRLLPAVYDRDAAVAEFAGRGGRAAQSTRYEAAGMFNGSAAGHSADLGHEQLTQPRRGLNR